MEKDDLICVWCGWSGEQDDLRPNDDNVDACPECSRADCLTDTDLDVYR